MSFEVAAHTIFATLAGSHAHGTSRQGSDVDVRGVCVAPRRIRLSLFEDFQQWEGGLEGGLRPLLLPGLEAHTTAGTAPAIEVETVIYDVAKFLRLLASANPNALEILFAHPDDWIVAEPAWRVLCEQRHRFLTQKVQQTFLGYAMGQLKKIKSHRSWLLAPPKAKPTREHFGLPSTATLGPTDRDRIEQAIADKVREYGIDSLELPKAARIAVQQRLERFWLDTMGVDSHELEQRMRALASYSLNLPAEVIETLNAEKRYRAAMRHWESYQSWKDGRSPARAELERHYGYDTKHAMHLVRLMRMGLEVLRDGELRVRRPDAAELSAIRDGGLPYDALLAHAEALKTDMEVAVAACPLPADVDHVFVDELLLEVIERGSK